MNSDQWTVRLSEYLDDELAPQEHAALEEHLAACPRCAGTLAELRAIAARAGTLEDRPPQRDLWSGIAMRIGVAGPTPGVTPIRRRRISVSIPQLAAAALVVAGIGAGSVWLVTGGPADRRTGGPVALGDPSVRLVSGETAYDAAVADLERVLAERRDRLDTGTVRVLEESLATIDRAITRARAALVADPSDPYLTQHLAQAMRRKLDLLRRATDLVAS
jgi:anti-sigma factor RsiW